MGSCRSFKKLFYFCKEQEKKNLLLSFFESVLEKRMNVGKKSKKDIHKDKNTTWGIIQHPRIYGGLFY